MVWAAWWVGCLDSSSLYEYTVANGRNCGISDLPAKAVCWSTAFIRCAGPQIYKGHCAGNKTDILDCEA